ncbi:MAG: 4Fe-4S binding protein [Anaerolineae bacterium]
MLVFIVLFVWSRRGGWPPSIVNLPMRLDPLAVLAHALANRTLLLSSALALVTVALTLALGRVWCGWLCPLGTTLDLFPLRRRNKDGGSPPDAWRRAKYVLLLTMLAAALLTNLTLMIFDPLTIFFRSLTLSLWPALDTIVTGAELALYQVPPLQPAVSTFDGLVRPVVLPPEPVAYRYVTLYAAVFLGVILLNLVARRAWCRYLCPLGALLGLLSKAGIVRREVSADCTQCGVCASVCPTATIQPEQGYTSDPGECTMCLECVASCPHNAARFPAHLSLAEWRSYDPGRRQVLASLGAAIAGVGLLRSRPVTSRGQAPYLIRPPGSQEHDLLSRCIRCGECMRACPTGALQPSVMEAGIEGLWTPLVVPRLGYCDYSCNACGQVCPVQAIPPLGLEEKREQVIGQAYIDRNRCIPWADNQDCIVCEEMCPVPDKAIRLERVEVQTIDGRLVSVQRPHVIRERCIGCGICEYKCPLSGEAAIRVYIPPSGV